MLPPCNMTLLLCSLELQTEPSSPPFLGKMICFDQQNVAKVTRYDSQAQAPLSALGSMRPLCKEVHASQLEDARPGRGRSEQLTQYHLRPRRPPHPRHQKAVDA